MTRKCWNPSKQNKTHSSLNCRGDYLGVTDADRQVAAVLQFRASASQQEHGSEKVLKVCWHEWHGHRNNGSRSSLKNRLFSVTHWEFMFHPNGLNSRILQMCWGFVLLLHQPCGHVYWKVCLLRRVSSFFSCKKYQDHFGRKTFSIFWTGKILGHTLQFTRCHRILLFCIL